MTGKGRKTVRRIVCLHPDFRLIRCILGHLPAWKLNQCRAISRIRLLIWSSLIGANPEDLKDPRLNIRTGAVLLKRIGSRLSDPSIDKIATIYNFGGAEEIKDYGARVLQVYTGKDWQRPPDPE